MRISSAMAPSARPFPLLSAIVTAWCLAAGGAPAAFGKQLPAPAASGPSATAVRHVRVMDFTHLAGPTSIVFRYTPLAAGSAGQAEIEPYRAWLRIHGTFSNLPAASRLGPQYLTYTLWQVTPDGRTTNLGEIGLTGSEGEIRTKSRSRQFGLIVTAEPYFAVSQPSSALAFESDVPPGATATGPLTEANFELLRAPIGSTLVAYSATGPTSEPLLFEEARRALAVARAAGAAEYAPQTLDTAEQTLQIARKLQGQRAKPTDVRDAAMEAVLIAEDARVLAVARQRRAQAAGVARDPAP